MTGESPEEDDFDNPLWLILKTVIPIEILSEAKRRLLEPEWNLFFQKIQALGLFFTFCSVSILLTLQGLASIISHPVNPVSVITGLLQNLTLIGIAIFLIVAVTVRTVQTVSGEKQIYDPYHQKIERLNERVDQEHPVVGILLQAIFTILLVWVTVVYRNVLIIDYPEMTSLNSFLIWILVFALDIGYLGLLTSLISQVWNYLRFAFLLPDRG
jgi:hypothetical protein